MEFSLTEVQAVLLAQEENRLLATNETTAHFALTLSAAQAKELLRLRGEALARTGRMEFGASPLPLIIDAFCDSPYLTQQNYADTLAQLQDIFYECKNESEDTIGDDDLIRVMKQVFNTVAGGSAEYLASTSLSQLCREARLGYRLF